MDASNQKWQGHTYAKYFLSYLLIVTILILGFFIIIKSQITDRFFKQRSEQFQVQLANMSEWLNSSFLHLNQVDTALDEDIILISYLYTQENPHLYYAYQELLKFDSSVQLVQTIVYKPKNFEKLIYTGNMISYNDGIFYLANTNLPTEVVAFDPSPYLGSAFGQIILVSNGSTRYLLYFPSTSSLDGTICFYILDTSVITQQLNNLLTDEISAIALIDRDRQLAADVNGSLLTPYMDSFALESGIYSLDSSHSICVQTGVSNGFSLVALISQDSLTSQVNAAFSNSYLALVLLCIVALILVLVSMRLTYTPLYRLTQKLMPESTPSQDHLRQLEFVFTKKEKQNQMLTEKLDGYRLFMQKSLLNSLVVSYSPEESAASPNIDQFFEMETNKEIFMVQMMSTTGALPYANIQAYFQKMLPGDESCLILEAKQNLATFLINYTGTEMNKDEVLLELLNNFYEEKGYLAALSNGTDSPLDIPSLYENVTRASSCWQKQPVVAYKSLPPTEIAFTYPYPKLHQLTELLGEKNFSQAKALTGDIFRIISDSTRSESNLPDFFVCCILVDILTVIANCMNKDHIAFDAYEDLYTETLYFCRSCPYSEKKAEIKSNIGLLMDIYEREIANRALTPSQVIELMETSYSQPDFSIALLADKCHVSIAYMSYLIKKELNQSFSDYLWELRLTKAKELLDNSDKSIDEISVEVGYLNTSSFRRKFKQDTGLTPSQFRRR